MSESVKEYIVSTALTFLTAFLMILSTKIDTLSFESLKDGTIIGILASSLRLGLKMFVQMTVSTIAPQK